MIKNHKQAKKSTLVGTWSRGVGWPSGLGGELKNGGPYGRRRWAAEGLKDWSELEWAARSNGRVDC